MFRSVQGWGRSGGLGEGEEEEMRLLGAVPVAGSVPAGSGDGLFVGYFGEEEFSLAVSLIESVAATEVTGWRECDEASWEPYRPGR